MEYTVELNKQVIGLIIGESIFDGNTLLIKKGNKITPRVYELLKIRGLKEIIILEEEKYSDLPDIGITLKESDFFERKNSLKRDFFNGITYVASEKRYGKLLSDKNDYDFIENLFIEIGSNNTVYSLLQTLKSWDLYTYYHSIDVFILGSLLYRKLNLPNINMSAAGLLLHDIGKIEIPVDILNKPSKLSTQEFELVSTHTTKGHNILKKYNYPDIICNIALYHHERINGTGYPFGKKEAEIPEEIKISMIVDVYSALTLERTYRLPTTPAKAIQLILNESEKYDLEILKKFINVLKIYPIDSMVELTNNKIAKIIEVKEFQPTIPIVKIFDTNELIELPNDYSLTVKTVLDWKNFNLDENQTLIDYLINGEKENSLKILNSLCAGMNIVDYYIKISEIMGTISNLWEEGTLSTADEHIATMTINEIMIHLLEENMQVHGKYKGSILLSTVGNDLYTLPNKIIADVLRIYGWKVYNLGLSVPKEDLLEYILKKKIKYVGLSLSKKENLEDLMELAKWLKQNNSSITVIASGQALNKYRNLDNIDYISGTLSDLMDYFEYKSISNAIC
ncbi:HD domain-containing phosphohydrolase [Bacillus litorisediminis]|uniref:HD domain-containing phosphohydrolase n=1 Tax=Bacillus litorisediminis TaxID=2922713 RepID=UPI001FAE9EA8|nr:HD domain-containing phosphohydrolase [Bacillus litorisediminis]